MFGRSFEYDVNCPKCGTRIQHDSFDDMISFNYKGDKVVEERCEECGKHFLVRLDKYILPKIDYEHAFPILQQEYGSIAIINENLFNRLKEQNKFVTSREELTVAEYDRDELNVIMY